MAEDCTNGPESAKEDNSVCRDFLRNVCRRGKRCKYQHPENEVSAKANGRPEFVFCHDYQNATCERVNCIFIHCAEDEEEYYKKTGELPSHVLDMVVRKGLAPDLPIAKGDAPICKDNLKGDCKRGGKCKFRHLTLREYEFELYGAKPGREPYANFDNDSFDSSSGNILRTGNMLGTFGAYDPYDPPEPKRRHLEEQNAASRIIAASGGNYSQEHGRYLEDENLYLKKKLKELRKQVFDLTATNELLLNQNAQMRIMKPVPTSGTTVSVSPVTLASTITTPVSVPTIAQLSGALPLQSTISVVGTAGQPATLEGSQVVPTVVGSVATVQPVSLSGTAVALTRVSPMTSITPVSLTQQDPLVTPMSSIGTVAMTQAVPTVTISGPLNQVAAAGSSLSAPLLSYPTMSQRMRPIIPAPNMPR